MIRNGPRHNHQEKQISDGTIERHRNDKNMNTFY